MLKSSLFSKIENFIALKKENFRKLGLLSPASNSKEVNLLSEGIIFEYSAPTLVFTVARLSLIMN
jgi:hypothetical protein